MVTHAGDDASAIFVETELVVSSEPMVATGDVIGGRYRLVAQLASGGMGTVWRAEHTELHMDVALKVMLLEIASTPSGEKRFRREAQAAARLRSPHVVQVHDFGVFEGQPYLAMELLQGEDLDTTLAREKSLSLERCAEILDGIATGIQLAHEHGIIHRDLKPANIFLAKEASGEVVKVLDFGIAKVDSKKDVNSTTASGLIGSPAYMSPEQVWCEPVTTATDVWSMGVVAFEMVLGENPFDAGPLAKVFERIVRDDLPRARDRRPDLPESVDAFFERALERDPEKRFATPTELAKAFRRAIDGAEGFNAVSERGDASLRRVDPHAQTFGPTDIARADLASIAAPQPAELTDTKLSEPAPIAGRTRRPLLIAIGLLAMVLAISGLWISTPSTARSPTTSAASTSDAPVPPVASAVAATSSSAVDPIERALSTASAAPSSPPTSASSPTETPFRVGVVAAPRTKPTATASVSATAAPKPTVDPMFGIPLKAP